MSTPVSSKKDRRISSVLKISLVFVGSALVLVPFIFLVALVTGEVEGEEFSPDDFSRRHFSYVRPSWFPLTLRGIAYDPISDPLVNNMILQGLITPTNSPKTWLLVSDNRMPADSTAYDAQILIRYLAMTNEKGVPFWEVWNADHPEKAKILWPAVVQFAREGRFVEVSSLLELAISNKGTSVKKFQDSVNRMVAESAEKNPSNPE